MAATLNYLAVIGLAIAPASGLANGASAAENAASPADASPAIAYCLDISDKAADARIALQTEALKVLEAKLDDRIAALEQRRAEVQGWVEQQRRLLTAAESGLVEIYAKMDPEVAAGQLVNLDTRLGSSVLRQLKPREASAILNEMEAGKAAALVRFIAAASTQETGSK